MQKIKNILKIIITLMIILPIILWLFALLRCEVLTMLHGDEFETVYKENTMIGEIDYLKVLDYSDTSARVYYVGVDKAGGDEVIFFKRGGGWFVEKWYTIWSGRGGSASNVIWPYWWHFVYGGF